MSLPGEDGTGLDELSAGHLDPACFTIEFGCYATYSAAHLFPPFFKTSITKIPWPAIQLRPGQANTKKISITDKTNSNFDYSLCSRFDYFLVIGYLIIELTLHHSESDQFPA